MTLGLGRTHWVTSKCQIPRCGAPGSLSSPQTLLFLRAAANFIQVLWNSTWKSQIHRFFRIFQDFQVHFRRQASNSTLAF